jgi:acyl-CoA synthetase (AMP-forming)/AMP-acid ligase II
MRGFPGCRRFAPHPGYMLRRDTRSMHGSAEIKQQVPAAAPIPWASELAVTAQIFGDLVCVNDSAGELTFRGLAVHAGVLAKRLLAAGIAPGEPVATFLRNGIPAVWASVGVRIAGAAETPLNPALTEDERRYCVGLVGARFVVTTAAQRPFFAGLGFEAIAVEEVAPDPAALTALAPVPGDAFGRIIFTSGTTGRPKAIVHTHEARWIANLLQRATFPHAPAPGSRALLMTPFTHGAALIAFAYFDHGAAVELCDGVDLPRVERLLTTRAVDAVFAPPTVLAKLVAAFEGRRFEGVHTVFCGTSTLTPALYAKARALFGSVVRITYGKSEVVNPITVLPAAACDRYYTEESAGAGACVGWPASGVEVEVRRDDGARADPDEIGEVFLRARHMLAGHIDAAGFHPLAPGGFHATGDLGRLDPHGRLHLVGRTGDVIKSGGYKIFPEEIERALAGCAPALAVVTLPSEYWGEVIVAVAEAPAADWEANARAAAECLARYKHPRAYVALDALPRNPQGKIGRPAVRALVEARWRLVDGPRPRLERCP